MRAVRAAVRTDGMTAKRHPVLRTVCAACRLREGECFHNYDCQGVRKGVVEHEAACQGVNFACICALLNCI